MPCNGLCNAMCISVPGRRVAISLRFTAENPMRNEKHNRSCYVWCPVSNQSAHRHNAIARQQPPSVIWLRFRPRRAESGRAEAGRRRGVLVALPPSEDGAWGGTATRRLKKTPGRGHVSNCGGWRMVLRGSRVAA